MLQKHTWIKTRRFFIPTGYDLILRKSAGYHLGFVGLISRRVCSVPWCTCVARRDPARMSVHPRGGGTRAVCLASGYRARQTYGLHHSAAGGGGTSKVNQYADRGGPPTVNQCTARGGTQDPVRGQSLVAGDAIPGRVVR